MEGRPMPAASAQSATRVPQRIAEISATSFVGEIRLAATSSIS
jgi:hypothetical protein